MWPLPIHLSDDSGFAISSPTGNIKYNGEKELEGEAIFATYPALSDGAPGGFPSLLFKRRHDPPYVEGEPSPTAGL